METELNYDVIHNILTFCEDSTIIQFQLVSRECYQLANSIIKKNNTLLFVQLNLYRHISLDKNTISISYLNDFRTLLHQTQFKGCFVLKNKFRFIKYGNIHYLNPCGTPLCLRIKIQNPCCATEVLIDNVYYFFCEWRNARDILTFDGISLQKQNDLFYSPLWPLNSYQTHYFEHRSTNTKYSFSCQHLKKTLNIDLSFPCITLNNPFCVYSDFLDSTFHFGKPSTFLVFFHLLNNIQNLYHFTVLISDVFILPLVANETTFVFTLIHNDSKQHFFDTFYSLELASQNTKQCTIHREEFDFPCRMHFWHLYVNVIYPIKKLSRNSQFNNKIVTHDSVVWQSCEIGFWVKIEKHHLRNASTLMQ